MKPGSILWLITILSFIFGLQQAFITYKILTDDSGDATGPPAVTSAVFSAMFATVSFSITLICLLIRGYQVI